MVVALLAAVAGWRATLAGAAPSLPRLTAAQLLSKVAQARVDKMSGVVRTNTDLGLPALPDTGGALTPRSLLSGTHTLRIYLNGPDRQRVDLLGTLAQSSLVHDGRDLWTWSSATNEATHTRLPAMPASARAGKHAPEGSPQALAQQLLDAIGPTTTTTVGTTASVAGRAAYDLRLAPKTAGSLVKQADLFVDAATGLPLRVTVLARQASRPAIDVGFTSITLAAPPARVFTFTAPRGAKVKEAPLPSVVGRPALPGDPGLDRGLTRHGSASPLTPASGPRVLGTGWTRVLEIRGLPAGTLSDPRLQALLRGAPTAKGTFGTGRLLTTALLSALITDDGRVFVGAVTPQALVRTANSAR
jgi:outer membrane lipoprotein-sorting protein